MTGLPTVTVKLDDGTGTYPYDVSAFVSLPDGFSISRGRGNEFDEVQPSSLSLTFDNTTGVFTLGSGTYGITIDQRIQVTENVSGAVTRFTGYVQDWPVAWPTGGDTYAVAEVTAIDRLSRLARRKLRSMVEQEILLDTPQWFWPCTEAESSSAAGDISGNSGPNLSAAGSGTAVAFGSGTLGPDDLAAPVFAAGQYLAPATPLTLGSSASAFTFEFSFSTTTVNTSLAYVGLAVTSGMTLNGSGQLVFASLTGSANLADGHPHVIAYKTTASTPTLYVDGVSIGTPTIFDGGSTTPTFLLGNNNSSSFTGTIGQAAFYTSALSSARLLSHATAMLTGFATDTADARIARLASYANIATADQSLEVGQQPSIAAQATSGQSVLDAMNEVMEAEGGTVFIRGDGKLVMQNKSHRITKAIGAAALTLTAADIDTGVSPGGAKSYLFNTATGSRDGGAQQRSVYAAGVTANEEYPIDLSRALLPTDALVLDLLNWTTALYGQPRPRIPALTLDLLTLGSSTVATVLSLEIGDLITLSGLPSQTPASLGGLLVEGWTESMTHDSWTVTLNTVPSALFKAWVLDDATYSVLGTTTVLSY